MDWLLFLGGLAAVSQADNTPAQQSIASVVLGVGFSRLINSAASKSEVL